MSILDQLDKNYTYLVAVSGGSDSMALLDILRSKNFILHIVHVNYKTRVSSDLEQELVEQYAKKYNINISVLVALKQDKGNFENFARLTRYNFFAEVYKKVMAKGLFVAHHLDDFLETYLLQKKRGAIVSYYGIKEVTDIKGMDVYRPLLHMSKKELEKYCEVNQIPYHIDESNFSVIYQRNEIRINVLSTYSEKKKHELLKTIKKENDALTYKENKYVQNSKECIINNKIDLSKFKLISEDDRIYLLYKYIQNNVSYERINITYAFLNDIIMQLLSKKPNLQLPIHKNFVILKEYTSAFLTKKLYNIIYKYVINEGEYPLGTYFSTSRRGNPHEGVYVMKEDYPLTIRPYESGDKVKIKDGYKKVSRFFIDAKIPPQKRKVWPLIINNDNEVLLIPNIVKNYSRHNLEDNFFITFNFEEVNKNE